MENASDEELIRGVAAGDAGALGALVARYKDRVLTFMTWQFSLPPEEAVDMTQEVFLAVWRSAGSFRGEALFRTWLFAVARNTGLSYFRHYLARKAESAGLLFGDEEFENIPDGAAGILEGLEAGERRALVRRAVEGLPGKLKAALLLREWEELSYAEIAEALDVPVGTVRSRLHNAYARLTAALKEKL